MLTSVCLPSWLNYAAYIVIFINFIFFYQLSCTKVTETTHSISLRKEHSNSIFFWYLFTFILIYGLQIKNGKAMRKEKATITFNIVVLFYCDLLCAIFHYNTSPISLQLLLEISSLIHFLVSQVLNLESAIDFSLSTKYLISFYILQFSLHRLAHICPSLSTVIAQLSYYNSLLKSLPDFGLFPFWVTTRSPFLKTSSRACHICVLKTSLGSSLVA